jgi:hypothetical protein
MAIVLQPMYPIPNRSKRQINFKKDDDGVIDIGWCEGVLSDGRSFRAEMWAQDQISMLTVFFSRAGIDDLAADAIADLVENEGLVKFKAGSRRCQSLRFTDDAGNPMWSVNVTVGGPDETYLENAVAIFPYSTIGEPNSMLNSFAIASAYRDLN